MKTKVTAKEIRNGEQYILAVPYCRLQFLLRYHDPIWYNSGTYGWNFDAYKINGVVICTGYRNYPGKKPDYDTMREYDRKAEKIINDLDIPHEEKVEKVEKLLADFLSIQFNR